MTNEEKIRADELEKCPFCGSQPFFGLGKKGSCQLHGEPFQSVIIYCKKHECPAKPKIEAGDIYNGGETKARLEAAKIWNRRADLATRPDVNQELVEAFAELIEGAELHDEDDDLRPLTKWDCFTRAKQALAKYKGEKHE